jgi:hypothetical protein
MQAVDNPYAPEGIKPVLIAAVRNVGSGSTVVPGALAAWNHVFSQPDAVVNMKCGNQRGQQVGAAHQASVVRGAACGLRTAEMVGLAARL